MEGAAGIPLMAARGFDPYLTTLLLRRRPPLHPKTVWPSNSNSYSTCILTNAGLGGVFGGAVGIVGGWVGVAVGAIGGTIGGGMVGVYTCPFNVEQYCEHMYRNCLGRNYNVTPLVAPPRR
jgi:hypothetical protein